MRIPNPRECTGNADGHRQICYDSHDKDRVVVVLVIDEDEGDAEDEPHKARRCAARVNATQMLEDRCPT